VERSDAAGERSPGERSPGERGPGERGPAGAARPRVGLALGGGAARSLVHVGVLTGLVRAGIPIDCVAGTSGGSLIGAFYCAGYNDAETRVLALRTGWRDLAVPVRSRLGLASFAPLARWLSQTLGDLTFAQLRTPFAVVASDLARGERVVIDHGPVAAAVQASCAIPGVVEPVAIDGRLLSDGGVCENVPARAARALGADYVIGVDLMTARIRPALGPLGLGVAAVELLVRDSGGGRAACDCLIAPDMSGISYVRFSAATELVRLGERAVELQLGAIRRGLADAGLVLAGG
jgi:NTE family protein